MHAITFDTLQTLTEVRESPCVSMFVCVKSAAHDLIEPKLELKHLIQTARTEVAAGLAETEIDTLLAPAEALLLDRSPWPREEGGMALFLAPGHAVHVSLPAPVHSTVTVGEHFEVLPLIQVLYPDCTFNVLAFSRNAVALFAATRYTIESVHVPDMPAGVDNSVWLGRHEDALVEEWHQESHEMFERYLRDIDELLRPILFSGGNPLVLAAVEREVSEFRSICKYPHICCSALLGNPDDLSEAKLHERAWKVVLNHLETTQQAAVLTRFEDVGGTNLRSVHMTEILEAALAGRVETLLMPDPARSGLRDGWANRAIIETLRHNGEILLVPAARLPAEASLGALFRWASETKNNYAR